MGDTFAVLAMIEGTARVVAVTFTPEVCELLRLLVAQALQVPTACQVWGTPV